MHRDRLGLAGPLQHEQLRQDRHALEPDAERPQDLGRRVGVGEDEGEEEGAREQVVDFEGVEVGVVGGLVVVQHQVDCVGGRRDEDEFQQSVPEGFCGVGPEEVEVARHVDDQVQELRLEAYAACAAGGFHFVEQD